MNLKIGLTEELTNTQFAPLAVIFAHYQQNNQLEPLQKVLLEMRSRDFTPTDKLVQVLVSMLADCKTLSETNSRLKSEVKLASALGWERFADQSNLSRTLDELSLKQIDRLRESTTQIWRDHSQAVQRDWRSYLWLDFDLTGLPCGPLAEASQKGYFGDKKMPVGANWPGSAPLRRVKRSGRSCFLATKTRSSVSNPPC